MGNKRERTDIIRRIISEEQIGSQEELMKRLETHGVNVTQSTLSRDFKSLNISKIPHPEKGYVYVLNDEIAAEQTAIKVGKVNVDEQPDLARQFRVMSIPTLMVFKNGEMVRREVGGRSKEEILAMVD